MTDRWAVVLAMSAALGAVVSRRVPLGVAALAVAAALVVRSAPGLCLAAALATSTLAARAWAGLDPPPPSTWSGPAVLTSDPAPQRGSSLRFEARLGGRRVEAWARGDAARALQPRLAGERVHLAGAVRPVPPKSRAYLARRHIAARLDVRTVGRHHPAPAPMAAANGVRRTIMRGARALPFEKRALFAGFVLGDQRAEPDHVKQSFRDAGLSHLLVVSGSNVAFVLALAQPGLRRLRILPRLAAAVGILVFFGLLTRGEPSVLRAGAMAGAAVLASTFGRPATTQRLLCLAVTALVVIDPLLVGSVGFLLSVAATAGIAWLTPVLSRRLPLPVAVTLAAQLGVAPVVIPLFGGIPVVSLPANLLAIPAAGPVMMWGLAAGLPAGLLPYPMARLVHAPTGLLVGWIAGVADRAAASRLADVKIGAAHLLALAAAGVVTSAGRRIASRRAARARSP